jgi:hypothetical protein
MRSEWIPDGDAGVAATISKMQALITSPQGVKSWTVRQTVLEAVRGVERGQHEIDSVFDWIKSNIEFRGEYQETLQSPEATINLGAGDCDDQAVLAASMLNSLGYETRFRVVALHGSPDEYSHVYVEVRDKTTGDWIPLDPTVEQSYPGWEAEDVARSQSYGTIPPAGSSDTSPFVALGLLALGFFL